MSFPRVTVVVPTLAADSALEDCLRSLAEQTFREFDVVVVDNSGKRRVAGRPGLSVIYNDSNVGFGGAINQAIAASGAAFIATLNDDAVAHTGWLAALVEAASARYEIGMCASQIRLARDGRLDSAGMLIGADGSSKQRGHLEWPGRYARAEHALFPSGCAALYKREMLEEIGLFDPSFFLYCEDTDLGLRARWAAWECVYVPGAVVEHRYSHSAGRASALKAYYVERNRLFVAIKNLPAPLLAAAPFYSVARYFWHAVYGLRGRGATAAFHDGEQHALQLPGLVLRAHVAALRESRRLWRARRQTRRRLTPRQFRALLRRYAIGPRQVAAQ